MVGDPIELDGWKQWLVGRLKGGCLFEGVEGSLASSLVTSSRVKVDGSVDEDYSFEEHLLFGRFLACVAVKRVSETCVMQIFSAPAA